MSTLKNTFTFPSFEKMAAKIPDGRATHYRYYQEGNERRRYKEGAKLFSLDVDEEDQEQWPKARRGSYVVTLFQQREVEGKGVLDERGEPDVSEVDFVPGEPNIVLRVDLAGRPPTTEHADPPTRDAVQLDDLRYAHDVIKTQRKWLLDEQKRLRKEVDRQRSKKKKWRERAREAEEGSLITQLLRGVRENPTGSAKALKEITPVVVDAACDIYDHWKSSGKGNKRKEDEPIDVNPSPSK